MVSIAAFQAVDPGSIPGHRNFFAGLIIITKIFDENYKPKKKARVDKV